MEVTLLRQEELWGNNALKIMQDDEMRRASLSDLAVLLGGWQNKDCKASDDKPSGFFWSSSAYDSLNVRCVYYDCGNYCYFPTFRKCAVRPALNSSETSKIRPIEARTSRVFKGVETVLYGSFPQTVAQNGRALEDLYRKGQLQKTGKNYTFDSAGLDDYNTPYQKRTCAEYTYGGERYIRIEAKVADSGSILSTGERPKDGKAYWIKVEPIEWLKDKSGIWVAKQALLSGMQFDRNSSYDGNFKKTDMYQRLQEFGSQMEVSREDVRQAEPKQVRHDDLDVQSGPKMTYEEKLARRRAKLGVKVKEKPMSAKDQMAFYVAHKMSFMLHGPSGVGKTARVKALDKNLTSIVLRNGMMPEDAVGKTYFKDDGTSEFQPPYWYFSLQKKCKEEPDKMHILFIDEVTNVKENTQTHIYDIVQNRQIAPGVGLLPENVVVVLAGNEINDSSAAYQMPAPLIDRPYAHIYLEPNIAEWLEWGAEKNKDNPERLNVHPLISAYVAARGMEVFHQPFDENNPEKWPLTPRGWEMISDVIYANDGVLREELIANKIGIELAADLREFALNPPMGLEDVLEGTYDRDDIPHQADAKLALSLSLLAAGEKEVGTVRSFIAQNLGNECLSTFDSKWAHKNPECAIQIAQLQSEGRL